jgi:Sortase domain
MAGYGLGGGRRGSQRLAAAVGALLFVACGSGSDGPEGASRSSGEASQPTSTLVPTTAPAPTSASPPSTPAPSPVPPATSAPPRSPGIDAEAADPVRVEVPAIGVDAPVIALGLDPSGALEVPGNFAETGWWTGGPEPGEQGPAIIAGHVDSKRGPAVFYRLRELGVGDVVGVTRADGSRVEFTVQRIERHAKAAFPTESVYASTAGADLRLITCGGEFDRTSGHYVDNVIVFATRR